MTKNIRILTGVVLMFSFGQPEAQTLSDQEAQRWSRLLPPNSCLIRCPDTASYEPNVGFQVCGGDSIPICHCDGSASRMANCESDQPSVRASNPGSLRHVYTDSDAPEHVRFRLLLGMLDHTPTLFAREQHTYLQSLNSEIEEELARLERRIRCPSQRPRATGKEVAHLYTVADDAHEAIYRKYLAIAAAELGTEGFADLQRSYMEVPGGFTMTSHNHWSRDTVEIEQNLKRICDALDAEAFN